MGCLVPRTPIILPAHADACTPLLGCALHPCLPASHPALHCPALHCSAPPPASSTTCSFMMGRSGWWTRSRLGQAQRPRRCPATHVDCSSSCDSCGSRAPHPTPRLGARAAPACKACMCGVPTKPAPAPVPVGTLARTVAVPMRCATGEQLARPVYPPARRPARLPTCLSAAAGCDKRHLRRHRPVAPRRKQQAAVTGAHRLAAW